MKHGTLTLQFSTTGSLAAYEKAGSYPRFLTRLHTYSEHFEAVHVCTFDTKSVRPCPAPRSDYILYVGRLTAQKNLSTLLGAAAWAFLPPSHFEGKPVLESEIRLLQGATR